MAIAVMAQDADLPTVSYMDPCDKTVVAMYVIIVIVRSPQRRTLFTPIGEARFSHLPHMQ